MKKTLQMDLQFFAAPDDPAGAEGTDQQNPAGTGQAAGGGTSGQNTHQQAAPEIDYEKIASIIQGKQTVTEDTVLKNYLALPLF